MKKTFNPLAMAAAVAASTVGLSSAINAQTLSGNGLGDMAIIPYYSVQGTYQTGIHIINSSDQTQVVKLRFRRASDSMDALDINLVMSPKDVWTGNLNDDTGSMLLSTEDTTCTVPRASAGRPDGVFEFPSLYREGAEEGYVEVIAMGSPLDQSSANGNLDGLTGESTAIALAAKHVNGVPRSCVNVRENFFSRNTDVPELAVAPAYGNDDFETTTMNWWEDLNDIGDTGSDDSVQISYEDSDNVLRVSWFLRDAATGLEFGSEAIHFDDFLDVPAMTNQQFGLFSLDITGFDYPDLNGGVPDGTTPSNADSNNGNRDRFNALRNEIGVASILNDWSTASERNVSTDWVVTFPGQYTMLDYYLYTGELAGDLVCGVGSPECDFRDIPVRAALDSATSNDTGVYDREEGQLDPEQGELVVSPSIPGEVLTTLLPNEVNVIEWTNGENAPVLDSAYTVSIDTSGYAQPFGWAQLAVSTNNTNSRGGGGPLPTTAPAICDWGTALGAVGTRELMDCRDDANALSAVDPGIPMIGFIAWERSFPQDPSANYGRIIPHASSNSTTVLP